MEKIVCRTEPFTEGFQFHWEIKQRPGLLSLSRPLQSPVFKALQWNWTIGTELRIKPIRLDFAEYYLDISLNLVDTKGNKIEKLPDHPFFNASNVCATVSFLDENGKILMPAENLFVWFSKKRFGERLNTKLGSIKVNVENVAVQGPKVKPLVLLLEVGLSGRSTKILSGGNNSPSDTVEKNANSMKKLFSEGKFTDFIIRTGDGGQIRAHRAILNNSSRYFEAMFELGGVEFQRGELEVPESHSVMNAIIRFLYTGELPQEIGGDYGGVEMYIAADKYQVDGLKGHFEGAFEKAANELFSVENVCAELVRAEIGDVQCMKAKAAEFIRANRKWVMKTEGWVELCREYPALIAFLFDNN